MSTTPESSSRIEELLKELISKVENSGGGGGQITITIDDKLNASSPNPVQNKAITTELNKKANTTDLSTVAKTGNYNDLTGTPTIPTVDTSLNTESLNPVANKAVATALNNKPDNNDLATVATSGDYADLINKPEIPSIGDTSKFALQESIAEEYNPSILYADGSVFTFNGNLYTVDSTGDYIKSENLITAEAYDPDNGYVSGQIPSNASLTADVYESRWDVGTLGYISVVPNATYEFEPSGNYTTGYFRYAHAFYSEKGTRNGCVTIDSSYIDSSIGSGAVQRFTVPSGSYYVRLGIGPDHTQPNRQLYRLYTNMPKVKKTNATRFTTAIFAKINDTTTFGSENRNGIFKEHYLGTDVYGLIERVLDGRFEDLYLGNYITAHMYGAGHDLGPYEQAEIDWMIAAFNPHHNVGSSGAITKPHIALVPRTHFDATASMNAADTTEGGYAGTDMVKTVLKILEEGVNDSFYGHLLTHSEMLTDQMTDTVASMAGSGYKGAATKADWYDTKLRLMNEIDLFGTLMYSSSAKDAGSSTKKLPVFNFINPVQYSRKSYWLSAVSNTSQFAYCNASGYASATNASKSLYIRPVILIG